MKKLLKVCYWLAGSFAVLLILILVGFKLFFPVEKARMLAIEKGSAMLGRDLSVDALDLSLWGGLGLKLENVAVANPENFPEGEFLTAANVDLKLELLPLISGDFRIDRLIVNSPRISMIKNRAGLNNYTFKSLEKQAPAELNEELTPEARAAGLAVSFDRFEITEGVLQYTDDSSNQSIRAVGISLATSLENPESGLFLSSGNIQIDSLMLSNGMKLPRLAVGLDYNAEYDLNQSSLSLDKAELQVNSIKLNLGGTYKTTNQVAEGRFHLSSNGTEVEKFMALLPPDQAASLDAYTLQGKIAMDADIEIDDSQSESFVYSGSIKLIGVSVSHDSIPGDLQFRQAVLDFKPDNARLNIEDGTFDGKPINGYLTVDSFDSPTFAGELAGSINLAFLTPFMPEGSQQELGGLANFDVTFKGQPDSLRNLTFSGTIKISEGSYSSPDLPEPIKSFELDAYFDNAVTRINRLAGSIESGSFEFDGRVNDLVAYLMADSTQVDQQHVSLSGNFDGNLDLRFFENYLPDEGNPRLNGRVDLALTINGTTRSPESIISQGKLSITGAEYSDDFLSEKLTRFDAVMLLSPDTIKVEKMAAEFESSDVSFSGKLADPFPYLLPMEGIDRSKMKKPLFLFQLSSHRFNVDKLFPEAAPGTGINRGSLPQDSVSMILLPDIDGRGSFIIDTVIYSQVEFSSLAGQVKIYDRKIECYDVTGDVYSGKVSGNTTIDLNNFEEPVYTGKFSAADVEADDFISRFTKFGGHLFGKVNLDGDYSASGWEPEQFLNSMSMNSRADMRSGKMKTSGSIHSSISSLASKMGETFDTEQTIKQLATSVSVQDGKVILDDLQTRLGSIGDVTIGGAYSFTGAMDYRGSILLSKEWTEKLLSKGGLVGNLSNLFNDKSVKRVRLPIVIGGTSESPKMDIDYSALSEALGDNVKDQAEGLLKGLFKK
ncbi:MAG: AsmA family protein [bacterium]|nr:AsmA family protein [bacterium]